VKMRDKKIAVLKENMLSVLFSISSCFIFSFLSPKLSKGWDILTSWWFLLCIGGFAVKGHSNLIHMQFVLCELMSDILKSYKNHFPISFTYQVHACMSLLCSNSSLVLGPVVQHLRWGSGIDT
jgi:hypothetical protein